jgi:pterin-4a-carbinolamine dehydratase
MLKQFLTNLRKNRSVGASKALSEIGKGWSAEGEGAIRKEFKFDSFEDASNFIYRYTAYCHKINLTPSWSNVYNKVNVTINNDEFG